MKLLDTTPKRVGEVLTTLRNIIEEERENIIRNEGRYYPPTERLQELLFQKTLMDGLQGLTRAHYVSTMTNEDISTMCSEMGVTVEKAIMNTMFNTLAEMAKDMKDMSDEDTKE